MSEENTMITKDNLPNPQKVRWKNIAYYNTYIEANEHRNKLDGLTKIRRCGVEGTKFVLKTGILIKETNDE